MKLPAALAPWAQQLKIFPDEISLALGTLARRLAPFVSPLRSNDEISDLEPNGYDGVARRGIYERLLLSELALADELGDEFIRRAAMGEHLFLNLAGVAPSAQRFSAVLFDAGPDQLGTPRVAQLAALIVLARRAAAARSEFSWGVLQDAELKMFAELNESNIMILLEARTANTVSSEHLRNWREKFPETNRTVDVWLVGAENLKTFNKAKGFSLLTIEDVLEPNQRKLHLSVVAATGAEKQIYLELPDEAVATRLLRNPFEVYRTPEKTAAGERLNSFFFDDNGGKLFARGDAKSVLYYAVPNSPNQPASAPRRYRQHYDADLLAAAGRLGKSIAVVSLNERGNLRLDYPKTGNFKLPAGNYRIEADEFVLPNGDETLLPIYNLRFPNSPFYQAAVRDAGDNLFLLNVADKSENEIVGRAFLMATNILAAARLNNHFVYVGRNEKSEISQIVSLGEKTERRDLPFANTTQAFFGRGGNLAHRFFGLVALGNYANDFAIVTEKGDEYIQATAGSEVVGVFQDASFAPGAGLFELEENRRALNFNFGGGRVKSVFTSEEAIERIVFSARSPVCAYQTVSGVVAVFSLTHRAPVGFLGV